MKINPVNNNSINFGYKHFLKDLYLNGKLPTVKIGLYNKPLTKKTVTLEHIQPHSLGGASKLNNYALADKLANNIRGNDDIRGFLNKKMAQNYLDQFKNVVVFWKGNKFDGNQYIEIVTNTLKKLGINL